MLTSLHRYVWSFVFSCLLNKAWPIIYKSTLMMEVEEISEALVFNSTLTPQITREDFSTFVALLL
jgi:hypothetical protein